MRSIGLDAHRDFCEVAISEQGKVRLAGGVATSPEALKLFGPSLLASDEVVLEASGDALGIARILEPFVTRVVLADARLLARCAGAGFLAEAWTPDEQTRARRRLPPRRVVQPRSSS